MRYAAFEDLQTQRLMLRRLTLEDVPLYFQRLFGSPKVAQYMLWKPHENISESAVSVQKALDNYKSGTYYRWAVVLKEDNSLIGIIELLRFDPEKESCSFAYMLGEDFWGQGFGSEALQAAFGFAFDKMGISVIEADHFADNPASGGAMRRAGMEVVCRLPGRYEKDGIKNDAVMYRITKEQWQIKNRC